VSAVLTKPDRIEKGDEGSWLAMIRNQKEKFKHGWYCVKQPSTTELQDGITWEVARQKECDFFQRNAPWSTIEFDLKERLGTERLSAALGQKLFDLIVKRYLFFWYFAGLLSSLTNTQAPRGLRRAPRTT
jgi:Dynamin central region